MTQAKAEKEGRDIEELRRKQPSVSPQIRALCIAIMDATLTDLRNGPVRPSPLRASTQAERDHKAKVVKDWFRDAWEWAASDAYHICSYVWVCQVLEFDTDFVRGGLKQIRDERMRVFLGG